MKYREKPLDTDKMPPGIPNIIGNEAAERYSFYGMRTILVIFMTQYLWLMGDEPGQPMTEVKANQVFHNFNAWVYFTPLIGALISDLFFGKYRVIMALSLVYCAGHAALAFMGVVGDATTWLYTGLILIAIGSGGIKPCVSAHVGDQFGKRNQHLLTRIFNWFYFSINLGSFVSTALTPLTLEYYGPHVAFGIPGVLMGLATLVFWLGRKHFAHLPAKPRPFIKELLSRHGLVAIAKLLPMVVFVSVFWALFDQTGSSWIFQAQDMNRNIFGWEVLPSQIQSINPILVLLLVPVFAYLVYPAINRVWPLSPLRKISFGLFLAAGAFTIPSLVQMWIDAGARPHIGWHVLAFLLLTMAEIMVSIVGLEFFYTQAPTKLKSVIMSLWLLSVFLGNKVIAVVNHYIEVPTVVEFFSNQDEQRNAGFDGQANTKDDIVMRYQKGKLHELEFASLPNFERAATKIKQAAEAADGQFPNEEEGGDLLGELVDAWGQPIEYTVQNSRQVRLRSNGADRQANSRWDEGVIISLNQKPEAKDDSRLSWREKRLRELGVNESGDGTAAFERLSHKAFVGGSQGMTTMEGSTYYWFFTGLMFTTAILFVPFAMLYRERTYVPE